MNCKPGDIAYITCGRDAGRIVTCESLYGPVSASIDRSPHWLVTASWQCEVGTKHVRLSNRWLFPDARLRPITGLPITDDVTDEVAA